MTDFREGQAVRVVRDLTEKYSSAYAADRMPAIGDIGWVAETCRWTEQSFVVFVSDKGNGLPYEGRDGWWLRKGEIEAVETETDNADT